MEYVQTGLADMVQVTKRLGIRSLALPALGCGNGGLPWAGVREAIEAASSELPDVEMLVFEPLPQ